MSSVTFIKRLCPRDRRDAFTLIELLIVVAIIAILAAIAVPNFLEAQVRAKVSRAKADMRSLATGIEAYRVDENAYPKCNSTNTSSYRPAGNGPANATDPASDPTRQYIVLEHLSTPVAYMTSGLLKDPFRAKADSSTINPATGGYTPVLYTPAQMEFEASFFGYAATCKPNSGISGTAVQALTSDLTTKGDRYWALYSAGPLLVHCHVAGNGLLSTSATPDGIDAWIYDPTNGTVSPGNIFRMGGTGIYAPDPGGLFFSEVSTKQK